MCPEYVHTRQIAPTQGRTQGPGLLLYARQDEPARPRTNAAIFQPRPGRVAPARHFWWETCPAKNVETTARNPLFLFLLFGLFLFRHAQRPMRLPAQPTAVTPNVVLSKGKGAGGKVKSFCATLHPCNAATLPPSVFPSSVAQYPPKPSSTRPTTAPSPPPSLPHVHTAQPKTSPSG